MAATQQQEALYRQGIVDLEIQAYKQGQFKSLWAATSIYDASRTTAWYHIARILPCSKTHVPNCLLTAIQEKSLKQWILSMNQHGMLPKIAIVQQMASILVSQNISLITPLPIEKNWAEKFIQ